MKDQLSSENKLMMGRLNYLEEFKLIRNDLMKKFEQQNKERLDTEMKYRRIIYDNEKKFVIEKDKLKKDMELRLLQLAQDVQDVTELRIAASTQRVIRENIAINNEIDTLLHAQARTNELKEKYRNELVEVQTCLSVTERERDKAIDRSIVQLKMIDHLTKAYNDVKYQAALEVKLDRDFKGQEKKIKDLKKHNETLLLKTRILEQRLHLKKTHDYIDLVNVKNLKKDSDRLRDILNRTATAIRASLKLDGWTTSDPSRELIERQTLLNRLLEIISEYVQVMRSESHDTVATLDDVYRQGDLGVIKRPTTTKWRTSSMGFKPHQLSLTKAHSITLDSFLSGSLKSQPSLTTMPHSSKRSIVTKPHSVQSFTRSSGTLIESDVEAEGSISLDDMVNKSDHSKLLDKPDVAEEKPTGTSDEKSSVSPDPGEEQDSNEVSDRSKEDSKDSKKDSNEITSDHELEGEHLKKV